MKRNQEDDSHLAFDESFGNLDSDMNERYQGGFERSSHGASKSYHDKNNFGTSSINVQQQLKILKMMSLLKVEISCNTILDTLRFKVIGKIESAFSKIKQSDLNEQQKKRVTKRDLQVLWNLSILFEQKITSTINGRIHKNLTSAMCSIKIAAGSALNNNKNPNFQYRGSTAHDKSNSITSPYQINSKIESSERMDSQWDLGQSQGGVQWNENASRENRFLKKKKEKLKVNKEDFLRKMESCLSDHEAFIKNQLKVPTSY